jgi:hypothetical protein
VLAYFGRPGTSNGPTEAICTHVPELNLDLRLPLVLVVMVMFCALLYRAFKRNGWL